MSEQISSQRYRILLAFFSSAAGVALVIAGLKISFLNWIVDGPGWLVSRFISIDFHEGDGAAGLLLAIFLSWFWTAAAVFCVGSALKRNVLSPKKLGS